MTDTNGAYGPRFITTWLILATMLFCFSAVAGDSMSPIYFTNSPAIFAGRTVLAVVSSGDARSKTNIQSLLGSQVIFVGRVAPPGNGANLMLSSNVVLEVEVRPSRDVRPHSVAWATEVLGTLKSVDFEKRIIHIQARPEDWRVRETE